MKIILIVVGLVIYYLGLLSGIALVYYLSKRHEQIERDYPEINNIE